jgi:hypothetical protein
MKILLSFLAVLMLAAPAMSAMRAPDRATDFVPDRTPDRSTDFVPDRTPDRSAQFMPDARAARASQFAPAARATASQNQLTAISNTAPTATTVDKSSVKVEEPVAQIPIDTRTREKAACLANNIGVGNTFVWASKYSNTNNYASMVEDTADPANNVCFVRVELKSADAKINVSDVPFVYYPMGRTITCGAWADEKELEKRILDAKKSARTWGTVAGVVGGAGVGVGAMELFGNKLIGGAVQGQKALNSDELMRSQILAMKSKNPATYNQLRAKLTALQAACEDPVWNDADAAGKKPDACSNINYNALLTL